MSWDGGNFFPTKELINGTFSVKGIEVPIVSKIEVNFNAVIKQD